MNPMTPKCPPRTFDSDHPPPDAGASESNAPNEAHASNASKVLAWGPTLNAFASLRFGPGPEHHAANGSNVPGLGATLDACDSLDSDQGWEPIGS